MKMKSVYVLYLRPILKYNSWYGQLVLFIYFLIIIIILLISIFYVLMIIFSLFLARSCLGFQSSMMPQQKWSPLCSGRGYQSPMRWFVWFSFSHARISHLSSFSLLFYLLLSSLGLFMRIYFFSKVVFALCSRFTILWRLSWLILTQNIQTSQMLVGS